VVKNGDLTIPNTEWKISTMAVVCTTLRGKSTAWLCEEERRRRRRREKMF
jgi:hypothetical protein